MYFYNIFKYLLLILIVALNFSTNAACLSYVETLATKAVDEVQLPDAQSTEAINLNHVDLEVSHTKKVPHLIRGATYRLSIEDAMVRSRPGQKSYGPAKIPWVQRKFSKKSADEIQQWLDERVIPFVQDPNGRWIPSDRHHMFQGIIQSMDILKDRFPGRTFHVRYKNENSFDDWAQFEETVTQEKLVLLRSNGKEHGIDELPKSWEDMEHDWYRGIAWVIKKSEIIDNTDIKFAEFKWADVLRERFPDIKQKYKWKHIKLILKDILENPADYNGLPGMRSQQIEWDQAKENIKKYKKALEW